MAVNWFGSQVAVSSAAPVTLLSQSDERSYVRLYNLGPNEIYIDSSPGVTAINGMPIGVGDYFPGSAAESPAIARGPIYAICAAAETAIVGIAEQVGF